ncbi:hypothetical protein E3U55_08335 [Filobacillus milosensis]|uniref:Uncharacterized protein n=1 Tax=Filobacillus milosensis TaxID=94137 RepID=A0A4Y8IL24_9BACI|nr:hypothetical protein [Filobacillus milosensis]TFB21820.1 hypothetical protein E3U55_08335 [Filobacillus milosensis]
MGVVMMFMILSSVTPYLFYRLNKKTLAGIQFVSLFGMWMYYINISFLGTDPGMFSLSWSAFYLSLILAWVAWIMFIIHLVKSNEKLLNI